MKRLLYLALVLLTFAGCKKTDNLVFEERPEIRMQKSIEEVKSILTSSTNGWVASLPTQAGGGYGFYMAFDQNEVVKMYGDLTDPTATTLGTSTYRVKANLGAELIFDTYNYISLLGDPNPSSFGGATGTGLKSDVEFIYDRSTADSIVFIGKKYRQELRMVKASAAQKTAFDAGTYKTGMDRIKSFFATIKNPYIDVMSGTATVKSAVSVNFTNVLASGKRIGFTGVLADNKTVITGTSKFAFKLDGADLLGTGLVYSGITFVRMAWKDATTLAFYDAAGKEYVIKSNPTPLTPFGLLFGFQTSYPYKKLTISSAGLPTGVTSGFTAVYQQMQALFVAGGRSVTSTTFTLTSNSVLTVEINYLSGTSAFVASATYGYTRVDDVITLDNNPIPNVNWPTRAAQIKPLADYMLTGPFKIDWVTSTNPSSPLLGGLYRTADLTSFIYGTL